MIRLIIDTRENLLYNNIIERDLDVYKNHISIEKKNLELGDIEINISNVDFTNKFIFERKTLSDLNASINDGRYKEQKHRLLSSYSNNAITYIIEGDDIHKSINRNDKKISSSYFNTLYRDNIKIIFNKNLFETVNFILTLCTKIIDKPQNFNNNFIKDVDYLECIKIKSKKNNNITPDNCFILQLSQIPTISNVIATNIVNIYPDIRTLIKELDNCENETEKINLLSSINKVGKEKAKKILKYMKI